jgi:hypothetical protein
MLDQSRSVIISELKKALEIYRKNIEAIKNPGQLTELFKAKEIAKNIEDELSRPIIRRVISSADIDNVLKRTSQILLLEHSTKPYQAQKAINDLRIEIKALIDNLHGDPKIKPNYPWDDDKEDEEEKEEKEDNKENKKPSK